MIKAPLFWYEPLGWKANILRPFSWLFGVIVAIRAAYLKRHKSSVTLPVIVVGNITIGGTGKTPFVISLVKLLREAGYRPGIILRGYGAKSAVYPYKLNSQSTVIEAGDEAFMIYQQTQCPVVIDPNRVRAAQALTEECNVIVSDDGLQHYRLHRDIEIAIVDKERQYGNACLLPAGPLREPIKRLKTVDLIVENGALSESGFTLEPLPIENICDPALLFSDALAKTDECIAIAGIGHPQRFFASLEKQHIRFKAIPFPDHAQFTSADFPQNKNAVIIMTEKDAVKCRDFADPRLWVQRVHAVISPTVVEKILQLLKQKLFL